MRGCAVAALSRGFKVAQFYHIGRSIATLLVDAWWRSVFYVTRKLLLEEISDYLASSSPVVHLALPEQACLRSNSPTTRAQHDAVGFVRRMMLQPPPGCSMIVASKYRAMAGDAWCERFYQHCLTG